jgi:hypothetical protein
MKTRGIWVVALALALSMAAASTADASSRLTRKEAKRLAVKLGRKQVRKFDLRFYELGKPRRLGRRGIAFPYAARTRANTYCTATLRVRKRTHGRRIVTTARIGRQRCRPVPDDALAVERATRKAQRSVSRRRTSNAIARVLTQLVECKVEPPDRREATYAAIIQAAIFETLVLPNRNALDAFVDRLDRIDTTHRRIGAGIDGWVDFVDNVEALPRFPHVCTTLKRWKRHGWSTNTAPIDPHDFNQVEVALNRDADATFRTSRFLHRIGVVPRVAAAFAIPDLVEFDLLK